MEKLKDYIAYARTRCHPKLTDEAADDLISSYLAMRNAGSSRKVSFILAPRGTASAYLCHTCIRMLLLFRECYLG